MIEEILKLLGELENDEYTPKVVKIKIKEVSKNLLDNAQSISIRVDRSLQGLDDLNEDANIPVHIKTQLWDIASKLETIPQ